MAVKLFNELKSVTLSGLETPKYYQSISRNLFRVSIWGTLSSGSTALVSFIYNRSPVQESAWKTFTPYVFKASLASCGTFAFFAAVLSYKIWQLSKNEETEASYKLNVQVFSLENRLVYASGTLCLIAIFVHYFNPNQVIKSLAAHSVVPLMWVQLTSVAIGLFHDYQLKQKRKL
jgi:hypothetical protein